MDRLLRPSSKDFTPKDHPSASIEKPEDWVVSIESVDYVEDYILHLKFSDASEKKVDFGPFLERSLNPLIKRYLDIDLFKDFTLEHGDLYWHDYDLCFPIGDLYEGHI